MPIYLRLWLGGFVGRIQQGMFVEEDIWHLQDLRDRIYVTLRRRLNAAFRRRFDVAPTESLGVAVLHLLSREINLEMFDTT